MTGQPQVISAGQSWPRERMQQVIVRQGGPVWMTGAVPVCSQQRVVTPLDQVLGDGGNNQPAQMQVSQWQQTPGGQQPNQLVVTSAGGPQQGQLGMFRTQIGPGGQMVRVQGLTPQQQQQRMLMTQRFIQQHQQLQQQQLGMARPDGTGMVQVKDGVQWVQRPAMSQQLVNVQQGGAVYMMQQNRMVATGQMHRAQVGQVQIMQSGGPGGQLVRLGPGGAVMQSQQVMMAGDGQHNVQQIAVPQGFQQVNVSRPQLVGSQATGYQQQFMQQAMAQGGGQSGEDSGQGQMRFVGPRQGEQIVQVSNTGGQFANDIVSVTEGVTSAGPIVSTQPLMTSSGMQSGEQSSAGLQSPNTTQGMQMPAESLQQVVQHGQQQIQQQLQSLVNQSAQVTPKTKTALANLLNTRLQGTPRGPAELQPDPPSQPPSPLRLPTSQASQPQIASPSLPGSPVRGPTVVRGQMVPGAGFPTRGVMPQSPVRMGMAPRGYAPSVGPQMGVKPGHMEMKAFASVPQVAQFYGHDPTVKVPAELCLLGCVFYIADYDKLVANDELERWKRIICEHGGQVEPVYNGARVTHCLCDNLRNLAVQEALRDNKRCVTAYWLSDVIVNKRMQPPATALHFPASTYPDDKPCKIHVIAVSNFRDEERNRIKRMIEAVGAKYTGYLTRQNTLLICSRADGSKAAKAREWHVPVVNLNWLHDVMFGHFEALRYLNHSKYQQFTQTDPFSINPASLPHFTNAWRQPVKISDEMWTKAVPLLKKVQLANCELADRKRKLEEGEGEEDTKPTELPDVKRIKMCDEIISLPLVPQSSAIKTEALESSSFVPNAPVVLFTACRNHIELSKVVAELGGRVTDVATECTHVVMDKLARTVKFMCAVSVCRFILGSSWLRESQKNNKFADEKLHMLQDVTSEQHLSCSVSEIVSKNGLRSTLFKGLVFSITPGVNPRPSVLAKIIESAGGRVEPKRPPVKVIQQMNQNGPCFVVISCAADMHLLDQLIKQNQTKAIHNAEFVLTGVLRQTIDFTGFLIV